MPTLASADYLVLAAYAALLLVVCVRVYQRAPRDDELFLAGRSLGAGVVGLSLFASNISSTTLIGLPGAAWQSGIAVANYEWMAALVLLASAYLVVPRLLAARVTTVPEFLEQRFGTGARRYLSGTSLFLSIVVDTAGSLYAGALVIMLFVPGLSLGWTCAGLALVAGLYTAAGGLRAVVYTDVLQTVVLLVGSLTLALIVFGEFDFEWGRFVTAVPPDHLSLLRPLDDPALPWLGTLLGLPIMGFYYWTMNQYVAQRLLGARDVAAAGRGAVLAALLKLAPLFVMVLPGAMAFVLLPDLARGDEVFPRLIATYAPAGLAGLMIAGLVAAIMSSVDSALNSASTLVIVDFVKPRRPQLDARASARLGRATTIAMMLLAVAWAPAIASFEGLFAYLQQAFAYVTAPLVALFVLALRRRRPGPRAVLAGTLSGHVFSAACFVAAQAGWLGLHFTLIAMILFLVTLFACALWQRVLGEALQVDALQVDALGAVSAGAWRALPRSVHAGTALTLALCALLVWQFR